MTPPTQPEAPARRMSSDERRDSIITAALAVFGAKGYVGTTTDDVAKAASVSQPYVVRLFGTKEALFLATLGYALDTLVAAFRSTLASEHPVGTVEARMGQVYVEMLSVRGLHQTLSHAFLLGAHPVIGPAARAGFAEVWTFFRDEVGFDVEQARLFLAQGMLVNTMIGLRLVDDYADDPRIGEMFRACFPTELPQVLDVVPRGTAPW